MHQSDRVEIWQERLHRYSLSQMSVADFCRNEGVSQATFYKWKKKLQALPDPETESGRKDPQFLPLQFIAESDPTDTTPAVDAPPAAKTTIELPGGIRIRVEVPSGWRSNQSIEGDS